MLAAAYCDSFKPRISRGMVRLDSDGHPPWEGGGEGSPRVFFEGSERPEAG